MDREDSSTEVTIESLRSELTEIQRALLDRIWQHDLEKNEGIASRRLHHEFSPEIVSKELSNLGGSIVLQNGYSDSRYRLTLIGALLTSGGRDFQRLLLNHFQSQRKLFLEDPEKRELHASEIALQWNLSEVETAMLGKLLHLANVPGSRGQKPLEWSVQAMSEAESFPRSEQLTQVLEKWALRYLDRTMPVLESERGARFTNNISATVHGLSDTTPSRPLPLEERAHDPLKRRYQVFVSSTFTDLIEERKQVMQALLVTKCIPSGMELFPAANAEQWQLITQVIDDCDYYVLILAGRCGTIGPNRKSYTEMEYDYAVSKGKPVFAFFHSNLAELPGKRLEDDPHKKKLLTEFTTKVKASRLCHDWNSAEGLASAIKTTILHAIESDPRPGWVRADSVPTWNLVRSLEARIAELEGRSTGRRPQRTNPSNDNVDIPLQIKWAESDNIKDQHGCFARKEHSFERVVRMNLDEVLLHIGLTPGASTNSHGILRALGHSLAQRFKSQVASQASQTVVRIDGSVDSKLARSLLQNFLARRLLKHVKPPPGVRSKALYWQLAPTGIQRIAELNSTRFQSGVHE